MIFWNPDPHFAFTQPILQKTIDFFSAIYNMGDVMSAKVVILLRINMNELVQSESN